MSTGRERAMARELVAAARAVPMQRAPVDGRPHERQFFRRVDRETTWGLTLNK